MFIKTKSAQAIAMVLAGTVISVTDISTASASTQTMYNLSSGSQDLSTNTNNPTTGGVRGLSGVSDGWLYGIGTPSTGTDNSIAKWAGTTGVNKTPFAYTGAHLNWGVEMTGGIGGTGEISTFDSFSRFNVYADIDTAKGAWGDNNVNSSAGLRHDLDFGLFKSDTSGLVTLTAEGILETNTQFGFTIFKGMSTNTLYGHHGFWNQGNNVTGLTSSSLPHGGTTFTLADIVAYSVGGATSSNLNTISFQADANEVYTIVLGGYDNGSGHNTTDGYKLTVSQVPVPAAVWLMGTGLLGLASMRKKNIAR